MSGRYESLYDDDIDAYLHANKSKNTQRALHLAIKLPGGYLVM
jgi:hypothetical protein